MTRRRAILGILALVALAAAWWQLSDGLTSEEQPLVGTWREQGGSELFAATVSCGPDREVQVRWAAGNLRGMPPMTAVKRWSRRGTVIYTDPEPSTVRRAMRYLGPV